MKLKPTFLILFTLTFFGCSTALDAKYDTAHIPPPKSSTYNKAPIYKKGPSSSSDTRKLATQRSYKIRGVRYHPIPDAEGFVQKGKASWYGKKFHGRKTSNGETYNMYDMTAAHKTLPMNTWVSVHNLENNKKIVVRINDRGPFVRGRIIDLSYTGAKRLGVLGPGTAPVKVTALGQATSYSQKTKKPVEFKPIDYYKGNFTVQVGAFKIKSNAMKYQYKLSKTYPNAHIVTYTDDRGTFFRVRIGKYANLNKAMSFCDKIIAQGFSNAFAVAE